MYNFVRNGLTRWRFASSFRRRNETFLPGRETGLVSMTATNASAANDANECLSIAHMMDVGGQVKVSSVRRI